MLSIKEAGIGGYYCPETLPFLDASVLIGNENNLIRPLFAVGDVVLIQEESREKKVLSLPIVS